MRKSLTILLPAAALALLLAGCGEADDGKVTTSPDGAPAHTADHSPSPAPVHGAAPSMSAMS